MLLVHHKNTTNATGCCLMKEHDKEKNYHHLAGDTTSDRLQLLKGDPSPIHCETSSSCSSGSSNDCGGNNNRIIVNTTSSSTSSAGANTFHSWDADNMKGVQERWSLNEKQMGKLQEFQQAIVDINHWKNEPHTCVHFLNEHKWNVRVSIKSFRKMVQWRIDNDVDQWLETYQPPKDFDYFPIATMDGCDHDGDPIHIERVGAACPWELCDRYGAQEIVNHTIYLREMDTRGPWTQRYEREKNKPLTKPTAIMDLEGLSTKHCSTRMLLLMKDVAFLTQDNYPDIAKRIIVIRAPFVFRIVWKFLQPFLSENTKNMIVIPTSYDGYLSVLEQYMDISVLPECINPKSGKGQSIDKNAFDPVWTGGSIPTTTSPEVRKVQVQVESLPEKDSSSLSSSLSSSTSTTTSATPPLPTTAMESATSSFFKTTPEKSTELNVAPFGNVVTLSSIAKGTYQQPKAISSEVKWQQVVNVIVNVESKTNAEENSTTKNVHGARKETPFRKQTKFQRKLSKMLFHNRTTPSD